VGRLLLSKSGVKALCLQLPILLLLLLPAPVRGEEVRVAVAANFAEPLRAIGQVFETQSGHTLKISSGSTGKLYAQIRQGAPFAVFLAADAERPALLEAQGQTVPGSRFTYALGQILLWSADPERLQGKDGAAVLQAGDFRHLAIANPRLAPYGKASKDALEALGLWEELEGKLVRGENIAQTYHFISTGNAELGFIATSQWHARGGKEQGSAWKVPPELYAPIHQDAVLLKASPAAEELLEFMKGKDVRALLKSYGYRSTDDE